MSDRGDERPTRLEWLGLALIVMLALFIRLYALGTFPDTVNPDEADNAQDALRIIAGLPPAGGFFGLDWKPQPAYSVYLISAAMGLVGESVAAIRLPSALIGALSVVPFFLLVRRQTSAPAAFAASFLLITNLWHVHFSRSGWENVQVPGYALGAIICCVWAVALLRRTGRVPRRAWALFVGAGMFCALGLYSYFSGRLIIVVLLAAGLLLLVQERELRRNLLIGYSLIVLTALVLFAPMLPTILSNLAFFNQRSATVLILSQPEFRQEPGATIWSQISNTITMLWGEAENNNLRYSPIGQALLEPAIRLLVIGGMLLSLVVPELRQRFETWLWWALLLIGWFVTQVLTTHTPDPARGTLIIPAFFFFVALSIGWLMQAVAPLTRRVRWPLIGLGALLILTIGLTNLSRYVTWQSLPEVREARQPYVLNEELLTWAGVVKARASRVESVLTVDEWRAIRGTNAVAPVLPEPLAQPPTQPAPIVAVPNTAAPAAQRLDPPVDPPESWPQPNATIDLRGADRTAVPRSIAVDRAGNLYILDSTPEVQTISRMSSDGQLLASWGGQGGAEDNGRFVEAWALAIDQDDHVLVLDAETGWVHVFDQQGNFLRKWGGPDLQLYKPRAMTISPDGMIYIADTGGRRVLALTPDGVQRRSYGDRNAGATGDAILSEPAAVGLMADGSLLVADAQEGLLRHYAADGALLDLWAIGSETAIDGPRLAVGPDQTILITLPSRCGVLKMSADQQTATLVGSCEQRGYIDQPGAVVFTTDGQYLISDLAQGRLLRFQP